MKGQKNQRDPDSRCLREKGREAKKMSVGGKKRKGNGAAERYEEAKACCRVLPPRVKKKESVMWGRKTNNEWAQPDCRERTLPVILERRRGKKRKPFKGQL